MTNERLGEYTLKLKNENVKLLFSMNFWRLLAQEGVKLEELQDKLDASSGIIGMLDTLATIIYCSGHSYARKFETEFDHGIDDIFEWFETDIDEKVLEDIINTMLSTKIFGREMNQGLSRVGKGKPSLKK